MGLTPADVVCSRMGQTDSDVKTQILKALEGQVYIPLIRDDDQAVTGVIGEVWNPQQPAEQFGGGNGSYLGLANRY